MKTALAFRLKELGGAEKAPIYDLAASLQAAIADCLVDRTLRAMEQFKDDYTKNSNDTPPVLVIAGGVASNQSLRNTLQSTLKNKKIIFPDPIYCTDNGAMICFLGEKKLLFKKYDSLSFSALPNLKLS